MKRLGPIALIVAALALAACGNDDSSAESKDPRPKLTEPEVHPPKGPPPTKLITVDLKEGSGPGAKDGDDISVHYLGVDKNGKELYSSWNRDEPLDFELGSKTYYRGWEEGLRGMKVGGRRELRIPKYLSFEKREPLFYIVDLLEIK